MTRRGLTAEQQLKGVEKALSSPRTPAHLKEALQKRADQLKKQIAAAGSSEDGGGIFDLLGLD